MWPWALRIIAALLAMGGAAVLGALARDVQSQTHNLVVLLSPSAAAILAVLLLVSAAIIVASPPARPTKPR